MVTWNFLKLYPCGIGEHSALSLGQHFEGCITFCEAPWRSSGPSSPRSSQLVSCEDGRPGVMELKGRQLLNLLSCLWRLKWRQLLVQPLGAQRLFGGTSSALVLCPAACGKDTGEAVQAGPRRKLPAIRSLLYHHSSSQSKVCFFPHLTCPREGDG